METHLGIVPADQMSASAGQIQMKKGMRRLLKHTKTAINISSLTSVILLLQIKHTIRQHYLTAIKTRGLLRIIGIGHNDRKDQLKSGQETSASKFQNIWSYFYLI